MSKPQVIQTVDGRWVVVDSIHPTKGAADKAANKTVKVEVGDTKMEAFMYERHLCALEEPAPETLNIQFNGKSYSFHFYINVHGRYVALCSTVGCECVHGEGANWWMAAQECMSRILNSTS